MKRLGYTRFVAQGGDWGAIITDVMAAQAPPELLGMHTNMPGAVPADVSTALARNVLGAGGPPPSGLSAEEARTYEQLSFFYTKGIGYAIEMGSHPQTLYGLADSPVGARRLDDRPRRVQLLGHRGGVAGHPVGDLTRDEVLDNVTFYWLTNTGVSSARLYWENKLGFFDVKGVSVPAAVSVFPKEIYKAPRSWAERAYPKLVYFNEVDRGQPLRRLAGADAVRKRGARRVPVTALAGHGRVACIPCAPPATPGTLKPLIGYPVTGRHVMKPHWLAPAGLHRASARLPVEGELPSLAARPDGSTRRR